MSICLCNLSADKVLELAAQNKVELQPAAPDPTHFVADPAALREALSILNGNVPQPADLLVGDAVKRRHTPRMSCYTLHGQLPQKGFFAIDEGVYVTSPELTLLLQARQLHQANLCQMLGRYMGTWSPAPNNPKGMIERAPLVTPESLSDFLRHANGMRGTRNLRLALTYTCEGAASPCETTLQLAFTLPYSLHGMGIVPPTMNYKIDLSTASRRLYPHESIRIDLCWRHKMFGVEYQGEGHGKKIGADYARHFAARNEGYELWYVADDQLKDAAQMLYIGREVALRIGDDINGRPWPTEGELQELLDTLSGQAHPKPLSYEELRKCGYDRHPRLI